MLRTELDALPVEEKTGLPFASTVVVEERQRAIDAGDARVRARPSHVGVGRHGAPDGRAPRPLARHAGHGRPARRRGRRRRSRDAEGRPVHPFPRPDFALSLHDDDTMPAGTIGYHPGYFRAMSDAVTITVYGRGGHAAMPHNTVDPIVLAARIVLALQTVVSRENNPVDPVVVTVGSIHGGTQGNVIPDEVQLQLSVRTYTPEVRARTLAAIRRIAKGEADAAGAPREPAGRCCPPAAARRSTTIRRSRCVSPAH